MSAVSPAGGGRGRTAVERRPATDAEARALASTLRIRILRMTLDRALTNKEIAQSLGRNPASVLHHVRTLVDQGFLAAQEVRRGTRGAREIPYRATGKSWRITTPAGSGVMLETFLEEISRVPPEQRDLTRLGLRLSEERWAEFRSRLRDLLDEVADWPRDPQAAPFSVFLAVHPDTSAPPDAPPEG